MLPDPRRYFHDPLYKNSLFIFLSSLTAALFGFFYWMLAARLYSSEDVGPGDRAYLFCRDHRKPIEPQPWEQ